MGYQLKRGYTLREAAKRLGMTQPELIRFLREQRVFKPKKAEQFDNPKPFFEFIRTGLFSVESRSHTLPNGISKPYEISLVTSKGIIYLEELIGDSAA